MPVFFSDREPAGPYRVMVPARWTRPVRFNDVTDSEPVPAATPCASVIGADVPIVAQRVRLDFRPAVNAVPSTIAYAGDA